MIQRAVTAAASGDTIDIGAGRFDDATAHGSGLVYVFLDGSKDLAFIGAGEDQTIIGPETEDPTWDVDGFHCLEGSPTLRLEDLRIEHIAGHGVRTRDASLTMADCTIARCHLGVEAVHGSVAFTGCTVSGDHVGAIGLAFVGVTETVDDCHLTGLQVCGLHLGDINELTVRDSAACLSVGGECAHPAIHGDHFLRDEAGGGWFVRAAKVYPWGPDHVDLTGYHWGITDLQVIADWILDVHDLPSCPMSIVDDPIADAPVSVEAASLSEVKALFRGVESRRRVLGGGGRRRPHRPAVSSTRSWGT